MIAGNWKMNLNAQLASVLVHRLQERIATHKNVEVVLAPSMLHIQPLSLQIDKRKFKLAAQNAHFEDHGAFTGEVAMTQLQHLVSYVIIGHSERRHVFGEKDDLIAKKVASCVRNGMSAILCVGETNQDKAAGETNNVLHDQVTAGLRNITSAEIDNIVIAYEPVWAISNGKDFGEKKTPKPYDVKDAARAIRKNVRAMFGEQAEAKVRVMYGGSTNPENAKGYLNVEGVDGLLVGGASLNYEQFSKMVEIAHQSTVQG